MLGNFHNYHMRRRYDQTCLQLENNMKGLLMDQQVKDELINELRQELYKTNKSLSEVSKKKKTLKRRVEFLKCNWFIGLKRLYAPMVYWPVDPRPMELPWSVWEKILGECNQKTILHLRRVNRTFFLLTNKFITY